MSTTRTTAHRLPVVVPVAIAARLRDDTPVFYAEELGYLVITRMEDIDAVFRNPDVFASANVQDPVFPLPKPAMDQDRRCQSSDRPGWRAGWRVRWVADRDWRTTRGTLARARTPL